MYKVECKEMIFSISCLYGIIEVELIVVNFELCIEKLKKGRFFCILYFKDIKIEMFVDNMFVVIFMDD